MTARMLIRHRIHTMGPHAGKTEIYRPESNEDGFHVRADPMHGDVKHHREHAIFTVDRDTVGRTWFPSADEGRTNGAGKPDFPAVDQVAP